MDAVQASPAEAFVTPNDSARVVSEDANIRGKDPLNVFREISKIDAGVQAAIIFA